MISQMPEFFVEPLKLSLGPIGLHMFAITLTASSDQLT